VLAKVNTNGAFVDCDSKYEHVRLRSEAIITQEINFAMHLSVNAIVIDMPQGASIQNFARLIASYTQNVSTSSTKFLLRIDLPGSFADAEAVYSRYMEFKALLGHSGNIQLILVLNEDLPSWEHFNTRWIGERIHSLQFRTEIFVKNQKGFPVLAKAH
jgi:PRMT5 TIM barrel domain